MKEELDLAAREGLDPLGDLRAYRFELEVQNQELRDVQIELQVALERYRDLYDVAPVGYLTLDQAGTILEANLTAADMFGEPRGGLMGKQLSAFISDGDQDLFFLQARSKLQISGRHDCELRLRDPTDPPLWVHLALHVEKPEGSDGHRTRCILSDVSSRKQADAALIASRDLLRELAAELSKAREEERARLARTLHDNLGQTLVAFHMDLSSLAAKNFADDPDGAERIEVMKGLVEMCMQTVTDEMVELRPPELDILGLSAAIEHQLTLAGETSGLRIHTDLFEGSLSLSLEFRTEVFRVFQEALRNVLRHAGAKSLEVSLRVSESTLVLEVEDDGIGIPDGEADCPQSFGLIGVRERAGRMGGRVEVLRRPEGGTRFRLVIPVSSSAREE